jgi:hypothetical protein
MKLAKDVARSEVLVVSCRALALAARMVFGLLWS